MYIAVLVTKRFSVVSGTLDEWSTGLVRAKEIVSVVQRCTMHIEVNRGAPGVQQRCNRGATEPRTYETHSI